MTLGQSPYFIKQLFPETNAIWLPQILGLFFPLGWLSLDIAGRLWLVGAIISIAIMIYLCFRPGGRVFLKSTLVFLLVFLFPPVVHHLGQGQISLQIALCLILASLYLGNRSYVWLGLLGVIALAKPQLAFLFLPGLFVRTVKDKGVIGLARLAGWTAAWAIVLLIPIFIAFPAWIPDFFVAIRGNNNWAQPSLFYFLSLNLQPPFGLLLYLVIAVSIFALGIWFWLKKPILEAAVWSLAFTCLVTPYIWSWDFVLLLPCFFFLLGKSKHWLASTTLVVGFLISSIIIWAFLTKARVSDEIFVWLPFFMVLIFFVAEYLMPGKPGQEPLD